MNSDKQMTSRICQWRVARAVTGEYGVLASDKDEFNLQRIERIKAITVVWPPGRENGSVIVTTQRGLTPTTQAYGVWLMAYGRTACLAISHLP